MMSLCVHPEYRRRGVAARLSEAAVAAARDEFGCDGAYVGCTSWHTRDKASHKTSSSCLTIIKCPVDLITFTKNARKTYHKWLRTERFYETFSRRIFEKMGFDTYEEVAWAECTVDGELLYPNPEFPTMPFMYKKLK